MRIALIADTNIAPLRRPLAAALSQLGITPKFTVIEGAWKDFQKAAGTLDDASPELVIVNFHAKDLVPELFKAEVLLGAVDHRRQICDAAVDTLMERIRLVRTASTGTVLVNDLPIPTRSPIGIQDTAVELGLASCIRRVNEKIAAEVIRLPGVRTVAFSSVVSRVGEASFDSRLWRIAGHEEGASLLAALAEEYTRHVRAIMGQTRKVLVVEPDGLFWNGNAADLGITGIDLNPNGSARVYYAVQQMLLDYYHRGVQLALVSRNEREDVLEILRDHPNMLLRPHHFAAVEVGWNDKATSCRQVAEQLDVSMDSIVYADVQAADREWVGTDLPKIEIIHFQSDAGTYARTLSAVASLESDNLFSARPAPSVPSLVAESANSNQGWIAGVEDYLSQLQTRVAVGHADRVALPSLVEIVERSEAVQLVGTPVDRECARVWMGSGIHQGLWVRVDDRFGDHGLVGLVVVEVGEDSWGIESFQLAGQLLERGVDAEVLRSVASLAADKGAQRLEILDADNANAHPFESLGFSRSSRNGVRCQLDLTGDWRASIWRPSYVEDTVYLGEDESEVAA
ncbi:MAG: hypothetical protein VX519_11300 [Myxococcota bacterium]|nr:hypothetical protein [Myxococcota bacterium]